MLIILSQLLRTTFPEVKWRNDQGWIAPEDMVKTKRESTLRCLDYVRQEITGSRCCAKPKGSGEATSLEDILEGLTVEAYAEVLEGSWQVVPERFFKGTELG
jgi:hypothetical protein